MPGTEGPLDGIFLGPWASQGLSSTSAGKSFLWPFVCVPVCVTTVISISTPASCWPHLVSVSLTTGMRPIPASAGTRTQETSQRVHPNLRNSVLRFSGSAVYLVMRTSPHPLIPPSLPFIEPYSQARHRAGHQGIRDGRDTSLSTGSPQSHRGVRHDMSMI